MSDSRPNGDNHVPFDTIRLLVEEDQSLGGTGLTSPEDDFIDISPDLRLPEWPVAVLAGTTADWGGRTGNLENDVDDSPDMQTSRNSGRAGTSFGFFGTRNRKSESGPEDKGPFSLGKESSLETEVAKVISAEAERIDRDETRMSGSDAAVAAKRSKARKLGFRLTGKRLAWGAAALAVVFRPWLVAGFILVSISIAAIAYFGFGPDASHAYIRKRYDAYLRKHPVKGERLRQKLERWTRRLEVLVLRLPEGWVQGLYLPDFSKSEENAADDRMQDDPFDRLADQLRNE